MFLKPNRTKWKARKAKLDHPSGTNNAKEKREIKKT